MRKYKVLQVVETIRLSGFVVVPVTYDVDEMEREVGEHLDVHNHFDDRESEVWDEWIIEVPEGAEEDIAHYDTIDFDTVKKYRIKED